jgi:hypothetical protein
MTERQILIRDAILGMIRRYPQEGVFLLPTLDMLALYFQEPVMFTFWKRGREGFEPFLSNVEDPNLLGAEPAQFSPPSPSTAPKTLAERPIQDKGTIWLAIPAQKVQSLIALTVQPRNDSIRDASAYAESLTALFDDQHFWTEFRSHLGQGVHSSPRRWSVEMARHIEARGEALSDAARKIPSASKVIDPHLPGENDQVFDGFDATTEFLSQVAEAIDGFLQARISFQPIHHPGPSNGRTFANLHFCISHALASNTLRARAFSYSARLFFTPCQEAAFAAHLNDPQATSHVGKIIDQLPPPNKHLPGNRRKELLGLIQDRNAARLLRFLKPPLQAESRATADLPFTSGCVAFGYSPGDSFDRARSEDDYSRLVTEKLLYGLCRPEDQGQYIFHIPIHVNGVAWMNIFTFTDKNPAKDTPSWRHNYLLYRDIITDLGAAIRQRTEDGYLNVLKELVWRTWSTPLSNENSVLDALNLQLYRLALTVPLPWVIFSIGESTTDPGGIPHSKFKRVRFEVRENPFFLNTLSYRLLTRSKVEAYIQEFAQSAYNSTILEENRFVAYTAHQIKIPLREMRAAVRSIPHEAHRSDFLRSVDWMIALEDWLSSRFDRTKLPPFSSKTISEFVVELKTFIPVLAKQFAGVYPTAPPPVDILNESNARDNKEKWSFCETQWKAVLQTMWDNAIRYGVPGKSVQIAVAGKKQCGHDCIVLRVRNEVDMSENELASHIAAAQRGDMNRLGLATLGLFAKRLLNDAEGEALHLAVKSKGKHLWEVSVPIGLRTNTKP